MTTPARRSVESIAGGCSGDSCEALDPWPVHQIRHRNNVFLRLCTSCVLKHHPGSFCCSCFDLLDSHERLPAIHCSKCPSVTHLRCLPDPSDNQPFLCPACDSPSPTSFSYFPYSKDSPDRIINLQSAKILLTAARLSSLSMNRAAAIARADAEKKVKEASLARKRAREMLDRSWIVAQQEKKKMIQEPLRITWTADADDGDKKAAQRRDRDREGEKWRRFSEPVGLVSRSAMAVSGNEKIKGKLNSEVGDEGVGKDENGMWKKGVVSDSQKSASVEQ